MIPAPVGAQASSAPAQSPCVYTPGSLTVSYVPQFTAALVLQQQLFSPSLPAFSPVTGPTLTNPPLPIPPIFTMSGASGSTSFSRSSSTASLAVSVKRKDGMNAKSAKDDMATVVLDSPKPASICCFIRKIEIILSQYVAAPTAPDLACPFHDLENPVINLRPAVNH
ncbi:hypothetical protein BC829DRAFT_443224 [Chytridium lagenaria]|nr:hypothetical protein BC829DRAFT_443224 [Chytridium lagenaria]